MSGSLYGDLRLCWKSVFWKGTEGFSVCRRAQFVRREALGRWGFVFVSFCFLVRKDSAVCPGSLRAEQALCRETWLLGICLTEKLI